MVDTTYAPKTYRKDGGDAQIIASGGYLDVETGGELRIGGTAITATAAEINAAAGTGVSSTELDLLDGALAGTVVASKAAVYSAASGLARSSASVTALSSDQAGAAVLASEINSVTAADDTKGVKLPTAVADKVMEIINTVRTASLKVYPATGAQINALGSNNAYTLKPGQRATFIGKSATLWHAGINPLGEAATDKVGLYGVTPVVQPASASQAAFTAQTYTAVGTTTFSAAGAGAYAGVWGFASSTVALTLRTQLNKVITDMAKQNTLLLQLRAELVELGAIKGAA